jgi:hypothetical protein
MVEDKGGSMIELGRQAFVETLPISREIARRKVLVQRKGKLVNMKSKTDRVLVLAAKEPEGDENRMVQQRREETVWTECAFRTLIL